MHRIIVFLGPSLEPEAAEAILPAEYRPPAKRGDLLRAAEDGATIIGLIDGVFHQESAVAHREILAAIKKGVTLSGPRAWAPSGLPRWTRWAWWVSGRCTGCIRAGELVSDDEVALVFDPETGLSLSEPLINIRFTLHRGRTARELLRNRMHAALLAAAQSVFYPQRTYRADRIGCRGCGSAGNTGTVPLICETPCR